MRTVKYDEDELRKAVDQSISIRQTLNLLGLKEAGGNYQTVKRKIKDWGIDISHFKGCGWNLGGNQNWNRKPLYEILIENSTYTNSNCLRKRLIKEKVLTDVCSGCGLSKWLNKKIPLELEHKNGDRTDNRLDNLELLCPNCHAFTKTYRGRNMESAKLNI